MEEEEEMLEGDGAAADSALCSVLGDDANAAWKPAFDVLELVGDVCTFAPAEGSET